MSPISVPVNADKVRERVNARALSDRQVSAALGLGQTGSRSLILDGSLHPSTTLATLRRITDLLALTYGELLDPEEPPTEPADQLPDEERVRVLVQLLPGRSIGIPLDNLAIVLGVTYQELYADLDAAAKQLDGVGFDLRITATGVVATRQASPTTDEINARLNQFRDSREGLLLNHASVLYRAMTDSLPTRNIGNDTQVSVGYLTARGALAPPASNQRATISNDTNYCLHPPDKP